jgi:hypothetical protein
VERLHPSVTEKVHDDLNQRELVPYKTPLFLARRVRSAKSGRVLSEVINHREKADSFSKKACGRALQHPIRRDCYRVLLLPIIETRRFLPPKKYPYQQGGRG